MFNFVRPEIPRETVGHSVFWEVLGEIVLSVSFSLAKPFYYLSLGRLFVNVGDWMESIILSIAIFIGVLLGTSVGTFSGSGISTELVLAVVALVLGVGASSGSSTSGRVGTSGGSS
ncbi:CNT_collapsed_G0025050.mRNA.1.CDS.1 [Saccharomyces cerevisiae]|nr:CNT_collapsed_G0025050.mRNA.1.CDS.1 [Saccharomyces cerevisiae]